MVLNGDADPPRKLAVPSSIACSNPLVCCWRPDDDERTNGFRSLKVRSGPRTTIESLTKSFLKEKLVERLAPIVPCNCAVVVCIKVVKYGRQKQLVTSTIIPLIFLIVGT